MICFTKCLRTEIGSNMTNISLQCIYHLFDVPRKHQFSHRQRKTLDFLGSDMGGQRECVGICYHIDKAWATGALTFSASAITSSCAWAQPIPQKRVTFLAEFSMPANCARSFRGHDSGQPANNCCVNHYIALRYTKPYTLFESSWTIGLSAHNPKPWPKLLCVPSMLGNRLVCDQCAVSHCPGRRSTLGSNRDNPCSPYVRST